MDKNRSYVLEHPEGLATVKVECFEYWPWQPEIKPVIHRWYMATGTTKENTLPTFTHVRNTEVKLRYLINRWFKELSQNKLDRESGKIITRDKTYGYIERLEHLNDLTKN